MTQTTTIKMYEATNGEQVKDLMNEGKQFKMFLPMIHTAKKHGKQQGILGTFKRVPADDSSGRLRKWMWMWTPKGYMSTESNQQKKLEQSQKG